MRSLENLADGGDYVIEYVTPDGLIYKVRMNDDFRVNINLMDEAGDTLQIEKRSSNNGKLEGNVIKKESKANLISNIDKDPRLVKAAKEMEKNERIQQKANHLISTSLH